MENGKFQRKVIKLLCEIKEKFEDFTTKQASDALVHISPAETIAAFDATDSSLVDTTGDLYVRIISA